MNQTINLETQIPQLHAEINYMPTLDDIILIKDSIVNVVNNALKTLLPDYAPHLVFVFSLLCGLMLMKKYKEDYIYLIIATLIIFGALRWFGFGG